MFESFDKEIYLSILLVMIIMALVVFTYRKSVKVFFTTLWSYASVLLSDYYSLRIDNRINRLLTGVWLMSCTVLLAAFSGILRNLMIKAKPILWIDSWDDLLEWKGLEIQAFHTSGLGAYIEKYDTPMTQNFKSRLKGGYLTIDEFEKGIKTHDKDMDYEGVRDGRTAIAGINK